MLKNQNLGSNKEFLCHVRDQDHGYYSLNAEILELFTVLLMGARGTAYLKLELLPKKQGRSVCAVAIEEMHSLIRERSRLLTKLCRRHTDGWKPVNMSRPHQVGKPTHPEGIIRGFFDINNMKML